MCLFALLYGTCDLCENASVIRLLRTYPHFDPIALTVGPMFSFAKNIFVLFSVVGIMQGFISSIIHNSSKDEKNK